MKTNTLNELAADILKVLPERLQGASGEAKKVILQAVQSGLQKMDFVTRDEFDVQAKILARTREKLTMLEKQVAALEKTTVDSK